MIRIEGPSMSFTSATLRTRRAATDGGPEREVLIHLLDCHPRDLTLAQLLHELGPGSDPIAVGRAVGVLIAAAFLQREGDRLAAAPSAVRIDRLAVQPA
jgi:hypothetical protein